MVVVPVPEMEWRWGSSGGGAAVCGGGQQWRRGNSVCGGQQWRRGSSGGGAAVKPHNCAPHLPTLNLALAGAAACGAGAAPRGPVRSARSNRQPGNEAIHLRPTLLPHTCAPHFPPPHLLERQQVRQRVVRVLRRKRKQGALQHALELSATGGSAALAAVRGRAVRTDAGRHLVHERYKLVQRHLRVRGVEGTSEGCLDACGKVCPARGGRGRRRAAQGRVCRTSSNRAFV